MKYSPINNQTTAECDMSLNQVKPKFTCALAEAKLEGADIHAYA
jgi:hypothetical protein